MKAKAASAATIAILQSRNNTMALTRSVRLNAGGLDLPRPIAEIVADELHELLGRLAHQLERVGREQRARFRRDEGAGGIGSDLVEHRLGQIGRPEQSPPAAGRKTRHARLRNGRQVRSDRY